jgi:hypothetical protein
VRWPTLESADCIAGMLDLRNTSGDRNTSGENDVYLQG